MTAALLASITAWIDTELKVRELPDLDGAYNGLQIENSGKVTRIVAAVDASLQSIEAAARVPGTLLVVHHGLFWDRMPQVTERRYRRIRAAIAADVAVYSAHLPLDAHPRLGNNILLAQQLGLEVSGPFGNYKGLEVGLHGVLEEDRDALVQRLATVVGQSVRLVPGGPQRPTRGALSTGGAGSSVPAAAARECDTFITGEGAHHTWFDAMEGGVKLLFAGHWSTEVFGVKALAAALSAPFGVPWEFQAQPTGM